MTKREPCSDFVIANTGTYPKRPHGNASLDAILSKKKQPMDVYFPTDRCGFFV